MPLDVSSLLAPAGLGIGALGAIAGPAAPAWTPPADPADVPTAFLLAGAGLVLVGFALPLARLGLHLLGRLAPPSHAPRARWSLLDLLPVAAAFVGALLFGSLFRPEDALSALLVSGGAFVAACAAAVLLARHAQPGEGLAALGFPGGRGGARAVGAALVAYVLAWPLVVGVGVFVTLARHAAGFDLPTQEVVERLLELEGGRLQLAIVLAVVVQPFLEELLFRGFLQPSLERWLGAWGAVLTTAAVFALMHGSAAAPPIFVLSVVLGRVRQRTGRLSAAWAVHALHNGSMLVALFQFPELTQGSS